MRDNEIVFCHKCLAIVRITIGYDLFNTKRGGAHWTLGRKCTDNSGKKVILLSDEPSFDNKYYLTRVKED